MYKNDHNIHTPGNNTVVWRYMDIEKFEDLVNRSAIHFTNIKDLGDPFEGSLPNALQESRISGSSSNVRHSYYLLKKSGRIDKSISYEVFSETMSVPSQFRYIHYVNCWHMGRYENYAIWKVYSKECKGIAIKTTIGRIIKSLEKTNLDVNIGKIKYLDYDKDLDAKEKIALNSNMKLFTFRKINVFKYEKEIRLLVKYLPEFGIKVEKNKEGEKGIFVKCEIQKLINEVYINPFDKGELYDRVVNLCIRNNLQCIVRKSIMSREQIL